MTYPTQILMQGKLKMEDLEYHTSILHDEIIFDWSGRGFKYQDEPIFFPSTIQVPLHGNFETHKLVPCFDTNYKVVVQFQHIVNAKNTNEMLQPTLGYIKMLTNDHDKGET